MAQPVVKGGILKAVIVFVVIMAVIVGGIGILANLTPADLNLDDVSFQGKTLREHGLSDYKIKEIFSALKDFSADSDDILNKIVVNRITEESGAQADQNLGGSSAGGAGGIDYGALYDAKTVYQTAQSVEYSDAALGALANNVLQARLAAMAKAAPGGIFMGASGPGTVVGVGGIELDDMKILIRELTIKVTGERIDLRVVAGIDLSKIRNDPSVKEALSRINSLGIIKVPDPLVVVAEVNFELSFDPVCKTLTPGARGGVVLQNNQMLSDLVFSLQTVYTTADVSNLIAQTVCRITNNLGKVVSVQPGKIVFETFTIADITPND